MSKRSVNSFTVSIEQSPETVFDYLADVSKHSEWSPKPYRVEGHAGPVAEGDTFTSVGAIPGDKSHRNEVTVTECSRPTRLVLDAAERGQHFINIFELQPEGGGTRVVRTMDAPQPPFPLSLVFPLILKAFIKPDVEKGLRNLKAALERTGRLRPAPRAGRCRGLTQQDRCGPATSRHEHRLGGGGGGR